MPKITIDFSDEVPGHVVSLSEPANNQETQIELTKRVFKLCLKAAGFTEDSPDQIDEDEGVEELRNLILDLVKLTGADCSDGIPTWPSIRAWSIEEVKRLREEHDALGEQLFKIKQIALQT